jgi:hypothetical protein
MGSRGLGQGARIEVIAMWWQYVIGAAVLIFLGYAFSTITGFNTRMLTRRTTRRAEDLYSDYADRRPPSHRSARGADSRGEDESR